MSVRILLVDGHDDARLSLVRLLESDGRVAVAAHVSTVPEVAAVVRDVPLDMALMNVQSHEEASIAQCQELRRLTDVPLVVLASFMAPGRWAALCDAGAAGYVLKHADSRALCSELVRLAGLGTAGTSSVS